MRQSVQRLADSILDAVLKAALLGQGPLAGLFGTGTTGNGGIGGIIGMIFGGMKFAEAASSQGRVRRGRTQSRRASRMASSL